MNKPLVAIVGRPNVGKSTIINGLAQRRVSYYGNKRFIHFSSFIYKALHGAYDPI